MYEVKLRLAVVEALRYKPERLGFDSLRDYSNFFIAIILGSTQLLTENEYQGITRRVKAVGVKG